MKKQVANICISMALCTSYAVQPFQFLNVQANEVSRIAPLLNYSSDNWTSIQQGSGHLEGDAAAIEALKHIDDFTMNVTFKMPATASGVHTLFFLGDRSKAANYISIYVLPGAGASDKIGIESRANGSYVLNKSLTAAKDINDDKEHKLTYTITKGGKLEFYLDGELIKEEATDLGFSSDVDFAPDYLGFGMGNRAENQNNYPFTGTMKDIEIYDQAISEEQIMAYHKGEQVTSTYEVYNTYYPDDTASYIQIEDEHAAALKTLHSGSISVRYRAQSADSGVMSLFSLSDASFAQNYFNLYVNPKANAVGIEIAGNNQTKVECDNAVMSKVAASIKDTNWHTITITKDDETANQRYYFYVDGVEVGYFSSRVNFLDNIDTATTIGIGNVKRSENASAMKFTGAIDMVKVYPTVLSKDEVIKEHDTIRFHPEKVSDLSNAIKTEPQSLYYSGYENSSAYRIPSLLKTKDGTLLAVGDQRYSGAGDAGNIDTVVRRKEAGSASFDDPIKVIDLVDTNLGTPSAFNIDASMVQDDSTGRIFLLVDMFPESSGLMNTEIINKGSGYTEVNGKQYQQLFADDNQEYTIRENGIVYDAQGNITDYQVVTDCAAPYHELGNLYKKGEYVGNIYLYSGEAKGELHVLRAQYLWMTYSDDDGKSWSLPQDLTPQVKADWMKFIGTGPGVGLQLSNGNLTFPVYTANSNVGGSQASAMIISKDHGETWELGESPIALSGEDRSIMNNSTKILTESQAIQLDNGDIKLFMRNYSGAVKVATSKDGGETWSSLEAIPQIYDSYCQLSVTHYHNEGKEYVALINPSASGRQNGKVYLGEVHDGEITWTNNKLLKDGHFQYSSIADLGTDEHGDQKFGVLYEIDDANGNISLDYTEFDENWVKAELVDEQLAAPELISKKVELDGSDITIELTFDQVVMAAGSPALRMTLNDQTFAATYKSGSGTKTLTFQGSFDATLKGILTIAGVDEAQGLLENIQNDKMKFTAFTAADLSEVALSDAFASTQHSTSTAPDTDGAAINVIDGNLRTYWHSKWGQEATIHLPQSITVELEEPQDIYKYSYTPRQNSASGRVQSFDLSVADEKDGTYTTIYSGTFANTAQTQSVEFLPVKAKFIRMTINTAYQTGTGSTSVAEINVSAYQEHMFDAVDKTVLQEKIKLAQSLSAEADRYSSASMENLKVAIKHGESIVAGDASSALVEDCVIRLQKSMDALIDITSLKADIQTAEKLNEHAYHEQSWTIFSQILKEIKDECQLITSSKELQDANMKLQYAVRQLEKKIVDKQLLNELYDNVKDTIDKGYTAQSWNNFQSALKHAQDLLTDDNVTQFAVDAAIQELQSAYDQLKEDVTAEKETLHKLIEECEAIDLTKYDEGVTEFKEALQEARDVYDNESSDRAALVSATTALTEAKNQLKEKVVINKEALTSVIYQAKQLTEYDYTQDSWKAMEEVLQKAEAILADEKADQKTIDEAAAALSKAIDALQKAVVETNKELLKQTIDEVKATLGEHDKYQRNEAYLALMDKLNDAVVLYDLEDATQEEVDQMNEALSILSQKLDLLPEGAIQKLVSFLQTFDRLERDKYKKDDYAYIMNIAKQAEQYYNEQNFNEEQYQQFLKELEKAEDIIENKQIVEEGNNQPNPQPDQGTDQKDNEENAGGAETGDATNVAGQAGILSLALASMAALFSKKKKYDKE